MKYYDIKSTTPVQFGEVVKALRAFVLTRTVILPQEFMHDLEDTMFETDQFHNTDSIDDVWHALNGNIESGDYLDRLYESMDFAIEQMSEEIKEYYNEPMNHAPGYTTPTSIVVPNDETSANDLNEILNKMSPSIVSAITQVTNQAELARVERENNVLADKAKKTSDSAQTKKQISDFVDHVVATYDEGNQLFLDFIIDEYESRGPVVNLARNVSLTTDEIANTRTIDQLIALMNEKLTPKQFIDLIIQNSMDTTTAPSIKMLRAIITNKNSKKKLYNMLAAKFIK